MSFVLYLEREEMKALGKLLKTSIEMDEFLEEANPAAYRRMKETSSRTEWISIFKKVFQWLKDWGYDENLSEM